MRTPLPIDPWAPAVLTALSGSGSVVVTAPPGSGKTTRLPLTVLESGLLGDGTLWLLQPRRVAARAAARRMAAELGEPVGRTVGFVTRDGSALSASTRIVVATEGVLTRKLLSDPSLRGVSAVMLDEFHERGRHTDLVLAMAVEVRSTLRDDLRLLVTSATLDPAPVAAFLGGGGGRSAPVVEARAPAHPVEVRNAERVESRPLPERAAREALRAVDEVPAGDVLVFLPGAGEIRRCAEILAGPSGRLDLLVVPLHGDLPAADQDRALLPAPDGRRKVVLATNVAETSLTIEGVTAVVDGGMARILRFDPRTGIDRLVLSPISRASATQRAGRAGRVGPGLVLRLYTREEERGFFDREEPELLRTDLAPPLLDVLTWAERDPRRFGWFQAPPEAAIEAGLALLRRLGAVEVGTHSLTPLGRRMASLPLHPRLSAVLISSERSGRTRQGATLAALLSEREVLASERALGRRASPGLPTAASDLLSRLDLLEEAGRSGLSRERAEALGLEPGAVRAVVRTRDRLLALLGARRGGDDDSGGEEELQRALLAGYPDRVGRRLPGRDGRVALVGGTGAVLDPASSVRDAELLLALDVSSGGSGPARIRVASAVEASWLPGTRTETVRRWDPAGEQVVAELRLVFEDLVLSERPVPAPLDGETSTILAARALEDPRAALATDDAFEALEKRLAFLGTIRPDLGLPPIDELLASLVAAAAAGRRRFSELREVPAVSLLLARVGPEARRALDGEAPRLLRVPSGREHPVDYATGRPVLAVKLQELFGLAETPRVAGGRVPVVLHLLSPAGRPVQVTTDLASFWSRGYPAVRRELRGRYPKHPWPEDPWTAPPQAGTKRRPG